MVEDLVIVGDRLAAIDAAGQHDQRHPVLFRIGDHIESIGQARADRRHQNARRTGHVIDAFGHETGVVFVFGQDEPDSRAVQRVDHGDHLPARYPKCETAPGVIKTPRDDIHGKRAGIAFSHNILNRLCGVVRRRLHVRDYSAAAFAAGCARRS